MENVEISGNGIPEFEKEEEEEVENGSKEISALREKYAVIVTRGGNISCVPNYLLRPMIRLKEALQFRIQNLQESPFSTDDFERMLHSSSSSSSSPPHQQ
eukprot:TRINITY_DN893_c0_g3_i2.p2 TRINITY_DN893_c0_g3~~TRINITY_DN893_c0_g3_i2.p2  ORF type:complete len:100 (-),score=46.63 TRINITY_DN893_c0_g3_i2:130-429(-)